MFDFISGLKGKKSKKRTERTFTIHMAKHIDGCPTKFTRADYTGRYTGSSPSGAASKALTQLCSVKKIKSQCTLYISMRETTQGSNKKVFHYMCKRMKLKEPIEISDGNFVKYKPVVHKVLESDIPKCKKSQKSSGPMKSKKSKNSHK